MNKTGWTRIDEPDGSTKWIFTLGHQEAVDLSPAAAREFRRIMGDLESWFNRMLPHETNFTGEAKLCDDTGMVSHQHHPKFAGSYIEFCNHLRKMSGHTPYLGEPFECTGSMHFVGEHFRCTSPAHQQSQESKT